MTPQKVEVWHIGIDPEVPFWNAVLQEDEDALVASLQEPMVFAGAGIVGHRSRGAEGMITRLLAQGRLIWVQVPECGRIRWGIESTKAAKCAACGARRQP